MQTNQVTGVLLFEGQLVSDRDYDEEEKEENRAGKRGRKKQKKKKNKVVHTFILNHCLNIWRYLKEAKENHFTYRVGLSESQ